jgi:SAM-dependent methyltransferase
LPTGIQHSTCVRRTLSPALRIALPLPSHSTAETSKVGLYRKLVIPRLTDLAMRNKQLEPYRERVIGAAEGRVLEIGVGSGLNLARYPPSVREVLALEPDPRLIDMARNKSSAGVRPVNFLEASAERIPLEDASVDTVVSTWTMCSIPDVRRALAEMRRVLRPGGQLLFVEHGLSADRGVRKWQNRLDPLWVRVSGGCHLNRPIESLIKGTGFELDRLRTGYMSGPRLMTFMYEGVARVQ